MSGTIQLPTTGTLTGLQLVQGINTALAEMTIDFRSATAPTAVGLGVPTLAGIKWRDSSATPEVLKVRNQADDAWIIAGYYDEATDVFYPSSALRTTNNLSDLADSATARTNLSVYSTAQVDALVATGAGTITATAGEAIDASTAPKLVYKDVFNQRGGGASKWYLVDSDATSPVKISPVIGFATTTAAGAGSTFTCQVAQGSVSGFAGLTADSPLWASSTAGAVTQTEPAIPTSGSQNAVRMVGYAISATAIMFEPWHDTVFQFRNSALAVGSSVTVHHWTDGGARERVARGYIAGVGGSQSIAAGGTACGDMTAGGGISAAFDGITSQTATNSAANSAPSGGVAYVGKRGWSKSISGFKCYAPSDNSFQLGNGGGSISATLQGSNDTTTGIDGTWTDLGSVSGTDSGAGGLILSKMSGVTVGTYAAHRAKIIGGAGTNAIRVAEVEFYEDTATREEPVDIGSETIDSASSTKVTVKFCNVSGVNSDTNTTFINRTGATRDLIAEITF